METVVDISGCAKEDVVKFVSQSFKGDALVWWRALIQASGKIPHYNLTWDKFVELMRETFCPQHEVEKVEPDFLTLGGLAPEVKGHVKASKPATYRSAVNLSLSLTLDIVKSRSVKTTDEGKRKREDDNSHRSDKKKKGNSGFKKNSNQSGEKPLCKNCKRNHFGKCTIDPQAKPCGICKKKGHKTLECNDLKNATCYGCNEKGHIKSNCLKNARKPEEAKKTNARVFQMNAREAVQDDKVITGADKSFVDTKFSKLLNLPIKTLDIKYEIELAEGFDIVRHGLVIT
ncbi:uncharacterized protein LOC110942767 [Helianthus annuus]|uniref:uncharacterized protein LOC110942767 n=1 Tax=Helianthus annuus TaxID=4232 RepID=UPI000B90486F|nr:uncharacterized protein LOC110942767 [Helianthus annuus]